jgi:sec-independent protein translocase protein TatA
MGGLGAPELILIVIVFLVFFGAKKIPELAQGLGKGIKEFRKGIKDVQDDIETETPTAGGDKDKEIEKLKLELEILKRKQELQNKLEEHK